MERKERTKNLGFLCREINFSTLTFIATQDRTATNRRQNVEEKRRRDLLLHCKEEQEFVPRAEKAKG